MPGRLAKLWLGSFVLLALLGSLWALAAPIGSGPDEGEHAIKAAAAARGELIGTAAAKHEPAFESFTVPSMYGAVNDLPDCYRLAPARPARCAPALPVSSPPSSTLSYVGRYPPAYYLLVGWPSRVADGSTAVYLMRLVSLLASAALLALALALALIYAADSLLVGGLFLAMTPAFTYLSSVVEPNGLEASAALSLWVALALLFVNEAEKPPRPVLHLAGLSAIVLVLERALSFEWLVAILIAMLALALPADKLRRVARDKIARRWACALGVASAAALTWVVTEHALDLVSLGSRRYSAVDAFGMALGRTRHYLVEMFGGFNPRGTDVPAQLEVLFWAVLAALVACALWRGRWRVRIALLSIAAATVLAGPVLTAASVGHDGVIWHGRYVLPFAVGLPILASAALTARPAAVGRHVRLHARHRARHRIGGATSTRVGTLVLLSVALACQVVALYFLLRRFAVGTRGPTDILFRHVSWQPPAGVTALVLGSMIVAALLVGWVRVAAPRIIGARQSQKAAELFRPAASLAPPTELLELAGLHHPHSAAGHPATAGGHRRLRLGLVGHERLGSEQQARHGSGVLQG